MKNPLRPTSFFFYVASAAFVLFFVQGLYYGHPLLHLIDRHKPTIAFLCLSAVFIVCYHRRHILAWWTAISAIPILFVIRTIDDKCFPGTDIISVAMIIYLVVFYYLGRQYEPYKEFIKSGGQLVGDEQLTPRKSASCCDTVSDGQNPLQNIFYVAILVALYALYNIVFREGGYSAETSGKLMAYTQQAVVLFMTITFGLFYWKKSMVAWWIAVFFSPVRLAVDLLFPPFILNIILFLLIVNIGIIWYLILKYRPYKNYIRSKPKETKDDGIIEKVL